MRSFSANRTPESWSPWKRGDYGRLEALASEENVPVAVIGRVGGPRLIIGDLVRARVERLRNLWSTALERCVK